MVPLIQFLDKVSAEQYYADTNEIMIERNQITFPCLSQEHGVFVLLFKWQ